VLDRAGEPLTLALVAAWDPRHHAAAVLAGLAQRLEAFCSERYPPLGGPAAQ